jgi:hypothetical protein
MYAATVMGIMLTEWMPCGRRARESLSFCYMPQVSSLVQKNVVEIATTGFKLILNRAKFSGQFRISKFYRQVTNFIDITYF